MVGELEAPLEGPRGDPAVNKILIVARLRLTTLHGQKMRFLGDLDVVGAKTGQRHGNAVAVITDLLDIIRWPARGSLHPGCLVEHVKQPIKADR